MYCRKITTLNIVILIVAISWVVWAQDSRGAAGDNQPPVADAGLARYAAADPVTLNGAGSYDPDSPGPLIYEWNQTAGPSVTITGADTAQPAISGFAQTQDVQRCEFTLVVSDGELASLPDTVEVIIVPAMVNYPDPYGNVTTIVSKTGAFDPEKPTFVFFGGGYGSYGGWAPLDVFYEWYQNVNFLNFSWYEPDSPTQPYTYYGCANKLITYLNSVAPDYKQPIQTMGHSTGTMPAIGVARYLNVTYEDPRYAINRVSLFDAVCRSEWSEVTAYCANPVGGEQSWVDNYYATDSRSPIQGALNIYFPQGHHRAPVFWHYWSLNEDIWLTDMYNEGVTAGLYLSVIGPAKNLQLSSDPGSIQYYFSWQGEFHYVEGPDLPTYSPGTMHFYNESLYPARLPEPVTLLDPVYNKDTRGYLLTCAESRNVVGYKLLVGSDPYRVMDYEVISDTLTPPSEVITGLPFNGFWWTVRVCDAYGSTIYADPQHVRPGLDVCDLHRDGRVDLADFAIFAQSWYGSEASFDVAPWPDGDGIIDASDLAAFIGHWLEPDKTTGEVGYWRLDGNFQDIFGRYSGSAVGDPILVGPGQARVGSGAVEMDGDDFVLMEGFKGLRGSQARTCSAWIKTTTAPGNILWWGKNDIPGGMWDFKISAMGNLRLQVNGGYIQSTATVNTGEWVHVVAVLPAGGDNTKDILLYIDGVLVPGGNVEIGAFPISTVLGADFRIGADNRDHYFTGLIDDVRLYDRALSAEEIAKLANP